MTSQGSAHGRFGRAAEVAALEMRPLSLKDALTLVCLYAAVNSPKFEPAAVRWLGRLSTEGRDVTLGQLPLAAAALGELRGRRHDAAVKTLLRLL